MVDGRTVISLHDAEMMDGQTVISLHDADAIGSCQMDSDAATERRLARHLTATWTPPEPRRRPRKLRDLELGRIYDPEPDDRRDRKDHG